MGDLVWDFLVKPSNVGMVELWWDGPRWVAVGCGLCRMHSTVGWDGGSGGGRAVEFDADPAEHLLILRCYSDLEFIYIYAWYLSIIKLGWYWIYVCMNRAWI